MISFVLYFTILFSVAFVSGEIKNKGWWRNEVFYQIYPRSFMDTDGNGIGDLQGIIDKLDHFVDAGIGGVWLSPIYASPMVDFGYDVSDFRSIDPIFGTMDDFEAMLHKAKTLGIKVVMDFVPNHTSYKHDWFIQCLNGVEKYKDYYVWATGRNNNIDPPNNWISNFNGPAWTFNKEKELWYLHQFDYRQIDLNFTNPAVQQEMEDILKFWLEKGIDGFRVDAIIHIYEKDGLPDEPLSHNPGYTNKDYEYLDHIYTQNDPRNYDLITKWRKIVDDWTDLHNEDEKVIMTEAYSSLDSMQKYYTVGSDVPFNFDFITKVHTDSKPSDFKKIIDDWMAIVPDGQVANWVMGNHDNFRIASRYPGRVDQMTILAMILPGIAITYYGEEIAMENNYKITWEQTKDPRACNLTPETYQKGSRDPCRTPFQWDDSQDAGFSTASETWLPINDNYKDLNLAKQKSDEKSHFKLYQALTKLRTMSIALKIGNLQVDILNNDEVLAVARQSSDEGIVLLINFSDDTSQEVNLSAYLPGAVEATVTLASVESGIKWGSPVLITGIEVPPKISLVVSAKIDSSLSSS